MGGKPTHDKIWEELLFSITSTTKYLIYSSSASFSFILTDTYLIFFSFCRFLTKQGNSVWGGANDDLHEDGEKPLLMWILAFLEIAIYAEAEEFHAQARPDSLFLQNKRGILFSRCLMYSHMDSHSSSLAAPVESISLRSLD